LLPEARFDKAKSTGQRSSHVVNHFLDRKR